MRLRRPGIREIRKSGPPAGHMGAEQACDAMRMAVRNHRSAIKNELVYLMSYQARMHAERDIAAYIELL